MLEVGIAVAVVVVLAVGFWWTRGYGGPPGAPDDPAIRAQTELFSHTSPLGEHVDPLPTEREDREHQVE